MIHHYIEKSEPLRLTFFAKEASELFFFEIIDFFDTMIYNKFIDDFEYYAIADIIGFISFFIENKTYLIYCSYHVL